MRSREGGGCSSPASVFPPPLEEFRDADVLLSNVWAREKPSDCDAADAVDEDLLERDLRGAVDSRTFDDILPNLSLLPVIVFEV